MAQIRKILIANRGEIALRIIRTCRELGIRTVAVYSDADRTMPHVVRADEAFRIGPPPSRESYLAMDQILRVARASGADAIHPGYGFLSENAEFARRVRDAGLRFIGPTPEAISAMGDKTEARRLVQRAGVPTIPGTDRSLASEEDAGKFCEEVGYPVLIKAAAGGGGKGMRVVERAKDFSTLFTAAQGEARSAFGDPRVYLEKYLEGPRHIEFQILADHYGSTVHLGERECSIQRRHQKVVEESPSSIIDEDMRRRMGETAVNAAKACGYENAGTIEFLVDAQRNFYFLEMNTRLQVEHPVTELRTGLDLVARQIRIAEGEPLGFTQDEVSFRGHAIECRICAEDVGNGFLPVTGTLTHLRPSQGIGVRDDRGVEVGDEISVYYDSMIAKLIVWGATRTEAIERMKRALAEYEILGVQTTIPLCLFVMRHPGFVKGEFTTHFLADQFSPDDLRRSSVSSEIAAGVVAALMEDRVRNALTSAHGSSPNGSGAAWKAKRFDLMRA